MSSIAFNVIGFPSKIGSLPTLRYMLPLCFKLKHTHSRPMPVRLARTLLRHCVHVLNHKKWEAVSEPASCVFVGFTCFKSHSRVSKRHGHHIYDSGEDVWEAFRKYAPRKLHLIELWAVFYSGVKVAYIDYCRWCRSDNHMDLYSSRLRKSYLRSACSSTLIR